MSTFTSFECVVPTYAPLLLLLLLLLLWLLLALHRQKCSYALHPMSWQLTALSWLEHFSTVEYLNGLMQRRLPLRPSRHVRGRGR